MGIVGGIAAARDIIDELGGVAQALVALSSIARNFRLLACG